MRSLFDSPKVMRSVNFRRLAGEVHSVAKQASFNIAFGVDSGGFGKPKSMPKFDFRGIFSDVISENKLHRNLLHFWRLETRKIAMFFWKSNDLHKISFFDKDPKNNEFLFHFWKPKRRKFPQKLIQKCIVFAHRVFNTFSSILGPFWKPKFIKKSQIFEKVEVRRPPLKQYRF